MVFYRLKLAEQQPYAAEDSIKGKGELRRMVGVFSTNLTFIQAKFTMKWLALYRREATGKQVPNGEREE